MTTSEDSGQTDRSTAGGAVSVDSSPAATPTGGQWQEGSARESAAVDAGRLAWSMVKGLVWLVITYGLVRHDHPMVAGAAAGALLGDICSWFLMRGLELPGNLLLFNLEFLIHLAVVALVTQTTPIMDVVQDPEHVPAAAVAFLLVSMGKLASWMIRRNLTH